MGVGVGGLGCASVLSLAAAGVDRLVLVDRDYVALSDLNRQVPYRSADLGKCKVEAVSEALKTFNPSIEVEALDVEVHEDSAPLASRVDLVVDGLDNYEARFALNKACVEKRKPFIHAAVQSLEEARDYSAGSMTMVLGPCRQPR